MNRKWEKINIFKYTRKYTRNTLLLQLYLIILLFNKTVKKQPIIG